MKKVAKAKTVEDAVKYINREGYFVTSLTQLVGDVWTACLRPKGATTTSYGQDDTMLGALQAAAANATKEDAWNRKAPDKTSTGKKHRVRIS